MSFYHVLTSNVAPKTFPNNSASKFSTPLYNPYNFDGKWEVAVTQMTHSNCVYTFNGERYEIEDTSFNKDDLERLDTQIKIDLKFSKKTLPLAEFYAEIKKNVSKHKLLKHILHVSTDSWRITFKVLYSELFVVLSRELQLACQLLTQVITSDDSLPTSRNQPPNQVTINDSSLIISKKTVNEEQFQLKEENAEMSITDLMKAYNDKMPSHVTSMSWDDSKDYIVLKKLRDDGIILLLNKTLSDALLVDVNGYLYSGKLLIPKNLLSKNYSSAWSVSLIRLKDPKPFQTFNVTHHLGKKQFTTQREACNYLNSFDKRVKFSCDEQNITTMKILNKSVTVKFDDDLRDILAFDRNEYKGLNTFTASGAFSLTRQIHYLYVYCNINQLIRIGDTQAPLIAILPYDGSTCVPHFERAFKNPMYVSLIRNHIAQIDIEIRDDAGQLIPFTDDALTTIRLHFRQVYANL